MDVSAAQLKAAVEGQHGGTAALVGSEPVKEVFNGKTVWEGTAHGFDLEGHPSASRAYAWSSPVEGGNKRRFYAVLHLGGIRSPLDAVRAAIVAEKAFKTVSVCAEGPLRFPLSDRRLLAKALGQYRHATGIKLPRRIEGGEYVIELPAGTCSVEWMLTYYGY